MIIKLNGTPLSTIATHGIDIKYDLSDIAVDAYHVVHTPVNVDLSFAGHNVIAGDVNVFNWASSILHHSSRIAYHVADSLF